MAKADLKPVPAELLRHLRRINARPSWEAEVRRRVAGRVAHLAADWNDPALVTLDQAEVSSRGVVRCVPSAATLAESLDQADRLLFRDEVNDGGSIPNADGENGEDQRIAIGIDYYPNPDVFGAGDIRLLGADVFFGREFDADNVFWGDDDPQAALRVRLVTASPSWDLVPIASEIFVPVSEISLNGGILSLDFSEQFVRFRAERVITRTWTDVPQFFGPEGETPLPSYRPLSLELLPLGDTEQNTTDAFIGGSVAPFNTSVFLHPFTNGFGVPGTGGAGPTGPMPPGAWDGGGQLAGEFDARTLWGAIPDHGAIPDVRGDGRTYGWFGLSQRMTRKAGLQNGGNVFPLRSNWRLPYVVWKVEQFTAPFMVTVDIDLGATPATGVGEFVVSKVEPDGTSVEITAMAAGVPMPEEVADGETFAGREQTYQLVAVGTPSPDGWSTPELHTLGIEFLEAVAFPRLTFPWDGETTIDPVECKTSVAEVPVELARAGAPARRDGRDPASRLASDSYATDLQLDLWLGSETGGGAVPRLHLNRYHIARHRTTRHSEELTGLSRLEQLQITVPRFQQIGVGGGGEPIYERVVHEWLDDDIADVLRDVLTNVINIDDRELDLDALPAQAGFRTRMRIEGTSPEDGKEIADQLAFLCGGALDWEAGRITYVELFGAVPAGEPFMEKATAAVWDEPDYVSLEVDPGLEHRVPEYYTPFHPDKLGGTDFIEQIQSVNGDALELLGKVQAEERHELASEIARWCSDPADAGEALASAVGWRIVRSFGSGFRRMVVETGFPQPWIRRGAQVVVVTHQWTDRIPRVATDGRDAGRALRGRVAVPAIVIGRNERGTRWTLWVRDPQEIVSIAQARGSLRGELDLPPHVTDFVVEEVSRETQLDPPQVRLTCTFPLWPYLAGWLVEAQKQGSLEWLQIASGTTPELFAIAPGFGTVTYRARTRSLAGRLADEATAPTVQLEIAAAPKIDSMHTVVGPNGRVSVQVRTSPPAKSYRVAASTVDYPDLATTRADDPTDLGGGAFEIIGAITLEAGETAFISVLVYSEPFGGGLESELGQVRTEVFTPQAGDDPIIQVFEQLDGSSPTDIEISLVDPQNAGGTLEVWTNPGGVGFADPDGPPDGSVAVVSTPFTADDGTLFNLTGGGTAQLLNDVPFPDEGIKLVYARFTTDDGRGTGQRGLLLRKQVVSILDPGNPTLVDPSKVNFAGTQLISIGNDLIPAWHPNRRIVQVGRGAAFMGDTSIRDVDISENAYLDAGDVWRYRETGSAERIRMGGTRVEIYVGDPGGGAAGSPITWGDAAVAIFPNKEIQIVNDLKLFQEQDIEIHIESWNENPSIHFDKRSPGGGVIQAEETLGAIAGFGWDGSQYAQSSVIAIVSEGAFSVGSNPSGVRFITSANQSGPPFFGDVRINHLGHLIVGQEPDSGHVFQAHGGESLVNGLDIQYGDGSNGVISTRRNGSHRWQFGDDGGTETGGNTGSNWFLSRFDDTGAFLGRVLEVDRTTGRLTVGTDPVPGGVSHVPDRVLAKYVESVATNRFGLTAYFYAEQRVFTTGGIEALVGYNRTTHPTGVVDLSLGVIGQSEHDGDGDVTDMHAVQGALVFGPNSGGTITNYAGLYSGGVGRQQGSVGGVITNCYGLYVAPRNEGTNRWAVFTEGGDPSHFGGIIRVPGLTIENTSGIARLIDFQMDGEIRWVTGADASAGDDFILSRFDDTGAFIDRPITVSRSTGDIIIANSARIQARNAAGTVDHDLIQLNAFDNIIVGDGARILFVASSDIGAGSQRVSAGSNDSAGSGFRQLRIPNT